MNGKQILLAMAVILVAALPIGRGAEAAGPPQTRFSSPEQGVARLIAAVQVHDRATVRKILGPASERLLSSGDPVADAQVRSDFLAAYAEGEKIVRDSDERAILVVGKQDWPFPIPLVHDASGWYFDTKAGAAEIVDRRVGGNELSAIEVCRAYVDAQREYFDKNREYAQKILSSPGKHDGLYWPSAAGEDESPLGPLVANARAQGYRAHKDAPTPYHGYYYRVVTAQGPAAPGGAADYIVDGRMTGGFALVAFPARYGVSGVMTFMVDKDGTVYQKDLGLRTAQMAAAIQRFEPNNGWEPVKTAD